MEIRTLSREELGLIWTIDRAELVERVYYHEDGQLVLRAERYDMSDWPPSEREMQSRLLEDCFDRGGTFYGAFESDRLLGVAVLESRFIGRHKDQLQLKFLHVTNGHRNAGVGSALFHACVERARELGARCLYISATPSENTVGFYLRRACRVTEEVDQKLFELEPEDIHLEFEIPPR